ncbi:VIT and VWA domain-containing protein [Gemmata sp. JC717]|uniref:VIT and vWA domain-containing protein n=1 Tax=Gemmata algarum TaxID=2975278 RepID=UPI0021BB9235|nr:VIT and VWA domain-containing protein [Gemmata algarum]MDY3556648.1 VIT and VWA domain-containing protein [Gemmata algarum]
MLNTGIFYNSRSDGFGVLEVADDSPAADAPRQFVPLKRTELTGTVTGPLAVLALAQTFALPDAATGPIEAVYRFPLPGDAAVTGVQVRFGAAEIRTELKEREKAEGEYKAAKSAGRQAALVTRESPDVFTLSVAGIRAGEEVVVRTDYVQVAKAEGAGWSLRVPLTTAPRYVRADESNSPHANGQPLALLRDPGHRFALNVTFAEAEQVRSATHVLAVEGDRVQLREGEVIPDRDCVLTWRAKVEDRSALRVWTQPNPATGKAYFLALCAPPKFADAKKVLREVILLVDHSGSMSGAKWEAADWAVERFLAGLSEDDAFSLGLFHSTTKWFGERTRKATPENIRAAVEFLKQNRDQGGTELGVALEQALARSRSAETPARHVLILTDAEVTDAGRILRLADQESEKPNRRRISVLCIDAAPNSALASELAERGGGVSRFLTSNPDDDDVTTALDEVLADWSAPVLTGLTLEVNRAGAEATGRSVALVVPGPTSAIDVGDLPAGRPVWVLGRAPLGTDPLTFRLRTGAETVAEVHADAKGVAQQLKAFFGADRVRRLEYLFTGGTEGEDLRTQVTRLGYEPAELGEEKVFAENAGESAKDAIRKLLVRESLAAGVPSSETAFVAVRSEAGRPVQGTVAVANALPAGWSDQFMTLRAGMKPARRRFRAHFAGPAELPCPAPAMPADAVVESVDSMLVEFGADAAGDTTTDYDPLERQKNLQPLGMKRKSSPPPRPSGPPAVKASTAAPGAGAQAKLTPDMISRLQEASARGQRGALPPLGDVSVSVKAGQHAPADGAILYDSAAGAAGQFTFLAVALGDGGITADNVDRELTLLLFVGDLAAPRARVKLADVLRLGGRRPLNLRREAGQPVRLTLEDPNGAWAAGTPALEIVLGWRA